MALLSCLSLLAMLVGAVLLHLKSLELPQNWQSAKPAPRPGIWFCAHRAKRWITLQHMYFRISPRDPSWASRYPLVFTQKDSMGNAFCTLGAGPFQGRLKLEFNRYFDLRDPISFEEAAPYASVEAENGQIATLLASAARYKQDLPFATVHQLTGPGYNCNAMIAALAHRAGISLPRFSGISMLCIGVGMPVPDKNIS